MTEPTHRGSIGRYKRGCRCDGCRQANTLAGQRGRAKRSTVPAADVPHGASGYRNYACRCQICTEGNSTRSREYKRQRRLARST